jgi:hypothetical protein
MTEQVPISVAHQNQSIQMEVKSTTATKAHLESLDGEVKAILPLQAYGFLSTGDRALVSIVVTCIKVQEKKPSGLIIPDSKLLM